MGRREARDSMEQIPPEVLADYGVAQATLTPLTFGHINRTVLVQSGDARLVLQRLNPIFGPELHEDIEAVTTHLTSKGLATPMLVRTRTGALFTRARDGSIWRMLTHVPGHSHLKAETPRRARAAGALIARFHGALADLEHTFKNARGNIHDTARHLEALEQTLTRKREHDRFPVVERVATRILEAAAKLPALTHLPKRVVHGDPKISNVLFASDDLATCLVDLDTLSSAVMPVELGDALRSWCNPRAEDEPESTFDLAFFEAALSGYASEARGLLTREEILAIPAGVETIALELAARFAADALNESYFGWNREKYQRASEHNLLRAESQLNLARSVGTQAEKAEAIARQVFFNP